MLRSLLHGGKGSEKYFFGEGIKAIMSLLEGFSVEILLTSESFYPEIEDQLAGYPIQITTDRLWQGLSELDSPPKLIGIFQRPDPKPLLVLNSVVVLDRIQDPGNLGTLIRTAVASGWEDLICLEGTCDPYSPKVVRACAGSLGGLNVYIKISDTTLKKLIDTCGLTPIESVVSGGKALKNLREIKKPCLLLGNEGQGLSAGLQGMDRALKITLPNLKPSKVESLNVAVAGGILLYGLKGLI
ncbi:MAG: RNA methyltransferase [Candidatus Caenarcaniphilales bacterium]|nr:RNA methyltransferase [Candidatus Caenarcaniphilales bacterium]